MMVNTAYRDREWFNTSAKTPFLIGPLLSDVIHICSQSGAVVSEGANTVIDGIFHAVPDCAKAELPPSGTVFPCPVTVTANVTVGYGRFTSAVSGRVYDGHVQKNLHQIRSTRALKSVMLFS